MITFACKSINKEDLIRCSLNLNKTEYKILDFLFRNGQRMTTIGISGRMGLERTTVQKGMKNLMRKRIVTRKKENLKEGGYVFFYELNDKKNIKDEIKNTISDWYKSAIKKVEEI